MMRLWWSTKVDILRMEKKPAERSCRGITGACNGRDNLCVSQIL